MNLKITNIKDNLYTLLCENGNTYEFKLKFFGLKNNPEIGDCIKMNENLLDKKFKEYSKSYMFGPLDEPYGRKVESYNDIEVIELLIKSKKFFLKRFFG